MIFRGIEIKPEQILSIIPATKTILVRTRVMYLHEIAHKVQGDLVFLKVDDKELQAAKFEHIQHIKKHPDPQHRVSDFECRRDDGSFDFDKLEKLTESRKTRGEKSQELHDEIELMEKMKKAGIPYYGPLMEMMK